MRRRRSEDAETRRRRHSRRARRALSWGLLGFLVSELALGQMLRSWPEVVDREFGRKLADVRRHLAGAPRRPLVLMLGSSRVATGFRPGVLPTYLASAKASPLVYNFAQVGAGPEMALLSLHRLLALGIRPDSVMIEFWPPTWGTERSLAEFSSQINLGCLDWSGVRLLGGYVSRPRRLYRAWLAAQLAPLSANRAALLDGIAPPWLVPPTPPDRRCQDLDPLGWWSPTATVAPDEHRRLVDRYRRIYEPRLHRFQVAAAPDRALRALLDLCRRERIRATVVVLPEGDEFRRLYPAPALGAVERYLARVSRECRVPVVDARGWVADEGFMDGHHLLPHGAAAFTRRLGTEVLEPLLAAAHPQLLR